MTSAQDDLFDLPDAEAPGAQRPTSDIRGDSNAYGYSVIWLAAICGVQTAYFLINSVEGLMSGFFPWSGGFFFIGAVITFGLVFRCTEAVIASVIVHGLQSLVTFQTLFSLLEDRKFFLDPGAIVHILSLQMLVSLAGMYLSFRTLQKAHRLERKGYSPRTLRPFGYTLDGPPKSTERLSGLAIEEIFCPMCGELMPVTRTTCTHCGEALWRPGDSRTMALVQKLKRNLVMQQCIWAFYLYSMLKDFLSFPRVEIDLYGILVLMTTIAVLGGLALRSSLALWTSMVLHSLGLPFIGLGILMIVTAKRLDLMELSITILLTACWWVTLMGVYRYTTIRAAGYRLREMNKVFAQPNSSLGHSAP